MTSATPGQMIDRYRLLRLLGAGGMAEVWEALGTATGERVALKIARGRSAEEGRRLLREGRAAAALEHRNLLRVLDVVPHEEGAALVLPLVRGPALEALLRSYRPTQEEALWLFREIARGVAHAHGLGLVHRDLKPGNVLLDLVGDEVVPRVADFGLVKVTLPGEDATQAGLVFGTPAYAAPEQLRDASRVDERADLWSLGVMLVELLTGRKPFVGRSIAEILDAHARGPSLDGLPDGARWVAAHLLAVDPCDRLHSCNVMLQHLESLAPPGLAAGAPLHAAALALLQRGQETAPPAGTLAGSDAPRVLPRHHLPAERDAFIGREAELRALDAAFADGARLVTVLGPGGVGKTRLGLRHAWIHLAEWPGGVYFVDLTDSRGAESVYEAVAHALGVPLGRGDAATQLGHAIAGRGRCLLLLDGVEQIGARMAEILDRWMDRAAEARFALLSRVALGVRGERVLNVPPMSATDAVALFLARARDASPRYAPGEAEREAIVALADQLDGLPLAIELAAARVRGMSAQAILARIRERFRLLAGGGERPDRQATLRASLDWSWDLLGPEERDALKQLAVFEGGFSLEAAEAALDLRELWPVDAVQALLDRSWLRRVAEDRYAMLVAVQQYAAEKLDAAGGRAAAERRHGEFFARFGDDDALDALTRHGGTALRRQLELELHNLEHACRRAIARADGAVAVPTLRAVWAVRELVGFGETVSLARAVAALPDLSVQQRMHALHVLGVASLLTGAPSAAEQALARALAAAREAGDRWWEARLIGARGRVLYAAGALGAAREPYQQALEAHRALGDRHGEAVALGNIAILHRLEGDGEGARALAEQALHIHRERGNRRSEGVTLSNLGNIALACGRHAQGQIAIEAAIAILEEVGDRVTRSTALGNLGIAHHGAGRLPEAATSMKCAVTASRELGDRGSEASALGNLGNVYLDHGRWPEARVCYEQALAVARDVGSREIEGVVLSNLGMTCLVQGQLDEAERLLDQALVTTRAVRNVRFEGVTLGSLGQLYLARGELARARATLDEAERLLGEARAEDDLAQLLADGRVPLELADGQEDAARAALASAEALCARLGIQPASPTGRALEKARKSLDNP